MNKTVKYAIRFLAVPFVTGAVLFSTAAMQNVQAASEPSLQIQKNEVGTLEITLTAMEWKYDHSEPGGFKYYPGNNLADVEFTIYNKKDNTVYAKKRTDKNGKVSFQLPLNLSFSCKQTSAYPETNGGRYVPETRTFSGSFKTNGEIYQHTVYNMFTLY
ncbi:MULTISPECIES: SpaA isopeptide-forming pilin-related protein [Bacillus cereus group]|uniref:SpaA isopeptide-forming pilin-related protein n=1 Tax=Bacillus cereus group TaxID=86661 RepID=UPI0018F393D9|nr:SpaA isopeptide-forming pilin-related protein [Bacillus cereus]MBJ8023291.1 hypothetical protein [Bacillus cereus]MBJ8036275.1 hypothetical protein [Bacillus cereus]